MGRVYKPTRKEGGQIVTYQHWYVEWNGADGNTHRKMIGPDRRLAVQALARFEEQAARARLGLPTPADPTVHLARPVADLIREYLAELAARDTAPEYRALVDDYLTRLMADCHWHTLADLTPHSLVVYLGTRRDRDKNSPATLTTATCV